MLRRGFSLANVVILSALITLIGVAGLIMTNINSAGSRAENTYLWAEKAANAGLLEAMKRIQATGFCDVNQTFTGNVGNATYEVDIRRSSRICFIRSEGRAGNAKVIKTGILQAYYGVGLYTVRGNVDADIGTRVRLSGCDNTANPPCFVPAFIASGTVRTAIPPQACSVDDGYSPGIYGGFTGREAIITYFKYTDLFPLFFNVNCFNEYDSAGCDYGLLQIFEREYGVNPSNSKQDMFFDNEWGIPRVDFSDLPPQGACKANGQPGGFWWNLYVVDVSSSDLAGCTDIEIDIPSNGQVIIEGTVNRYLNIYVFDKDINSVYINSQISTEGFTLYSTKPINILVDLDKARIVTSNNIYTDGNRTLRNSTLILAPTDVNDTNNPNSGAELHTDDYRMITFENSYIFARHIHFGDGASIYILDSLVYVYAHACPNCDRSSNTSSLDKCYYENERWCGWFGDNIYLSVGRDNSGEERPSIIISNNSTVLQYRPQNPIYIWGAFVGEDITYLLWVGRRFNQNFKGFLVRNFPPSNTLEISISGGFSLEFSKSLLDKLAQNFWYFRKIQCIRDDISPRTQLIHTRLTAY